MSEEPSYQLDPDNMPAAIIYVTDDGDIAVAGRADLTLEQVAKLLHHASHQVMENLMEIRQKAKEN